MLMYQIRECHMEDAERIQTLNRVELGYSFPLADTQRKLELLLHSGKDKIYVAEMDGTVVGYVHACDYDVIYFPHMKNIMGIAVSSHCRRLGIGKALLSKIEDWARESGAAGVRLVSGSERTEAHLFYKRCGYDTGKMQFNFKKRVSYDIR